MTVFENIVDIAAWCGLSETEEKRILEAGTSADALIKTADYLKSGSFSKEPFRLEDNNTGKIIGTWKSLVEFVLSKPSKNLLEKTVCTEFTSTDNYEDFNGSTWLVD